MERGWIKIWRRLEDSEVFQDPILLKVWLWCLMKASHKTEYIPVKTGRGITTVEVHRGQFLFGRKEAAKALLLPPSTVRNKMSRLGTLRNLDMQPDTHFSIVTICNYNDYQTIDEYELDRQQDRQRTGKGQAKDTYKNEKNEKKEKKESIKPKSLRFQKPTIDQLTAYAASIDFPDLDPYRFFDYYESQGWRVGKNPMKSWEAAVRTWKRNAKGNGDGRSGESWRRALAGYSTELLRALAEGHRDIREELGVTADEVRAFLAERETEEGRLS